MGSKELLLRLIVEDIDRFVNLDISGHGVIAGIYQAVWEHYVAPPPRLRRNSCAWPCPTVGRFFVTSGRLIPRFYPDGPISAAILGRALSQAFDARMEVLTEAKIVATPWPLHLGNSHRIIVPIPMPLDTARTEPKDYSTPMRPKPSCRRRRTAPTPKASIVWSASMAIKTV